MITQIQYVLLMECAIGVAGGAIAPPNFNLVGQTMHYAPPDFKTKLSFYFKYVH